MMSIAGKYMYKGNGTVDLDNVWHVILHISFSSCKVLYGCHKELWKNCTFTGVIESKPLYCSEFTIFFSCGDCCGGLSHCSHNTWSFWDSLVMLLEYFLMMIFLIRMIISSSIDLRRGYRSTRTDAGRFIGYIDEFYMLSRTTFLVLLVNKGNQSRNRGFLEEISGGGRKVCLIFFSSVWIIEDDVGDVGSSMVWIMRHGSHIGNDLCYIVSMLNVYLKVFYGIRDFLDWWVRKPNVKNVRLLSLLRGQRDCYYFMLHVMIFHAFSVTKESGKNGSFKRVVALWIFMKWLRLQRNDNRWIMGNGYHYTRQSGSLEQIKKIVFNESFELELSRNGK